MNTKFENIILQEALRQFSHITGAKARELPATGKIMDAILQLTIGKEKHVFKVEIKNEIRSTHMPGIIEQVGREKDHWLLVSKYIPGPLKDRLKEGGINYLETAGNCFIHTGGLFLYINDRPVTPSRQTATGKLWKQTGLKFLFAILSDPSLLNVPYRRIADISGIALGSVGPLLEELEQAGHIYEQKQGLTLTGRQQLIQRWAELFQVVLRPRLAKGRFRFLQKEMQYEWKTVKLAGLWGAEPAADLLTGHLKPEIFTIYTGEPVQGLMKTLRLVPDPVGNIELVEQFWKDTLHQRVGRTPHAVPPLLAYADLIAGPDSRHWEVANRIKNRYLHD